MKPNWFTMGLALVVLALIVLSPFAIVWALNTLFALGIEYTFWTWLAALVLLSAVSRGEIARAKK